MLALSLWLALAILPNAASYPPLSDDEARILSNARVTVSPGLPADVLSQGVTNADRNFFLSLPIQRLLIAAIFRVAGESIFAARLVTFISALSVLWSVGYLTRRWYGVAAMCIATFLLVSWRFINIARTARYDMTAVAWMWLALLACDQFLSTSSLAWAFLAGVFAGLAALTQFFGGFVLVIIGLSIWFARRGRLLRERSTFALVGGLALVLLPYAFYVAADWNGFASQIFILKSARTHFLDINFYAQNILTEGARYSDIAFNAVTDPAGWIAQLTALVFLLGIGAALANLVYRLVQKNDHGHALVPLSILVNGVGLALFDSTKAPLYAIVLFPAVCIAVGVFWVDLWRARRGTVFRYALAGVTILVACAFLLRYANMFVQDRADAAAAGDYAATISRISTYVPKGERLVTSTRMAWGLHRYPNVTTTNLLIGWELHPSGESGMLLTGWMRHLAPAYIVLDGAARTDLHIDPRLDKQWTRWQTLCTNPLTQWDDVSYGSIEILYVDKNAFQCVGN